MNKTAFGLGDMFEIKVDDTNSGKRAGKELVQLYTTDKVAATAPSVSWLKAFDIVKIEPGKTKTVSFSLSTKDLAFVGLNNKWVTESGEFMISINGLQIDFVVK